MKKFVFTTAVALILTTGGAYAQVHHGAGGMGGGGGGMGGGGMSAGAGVRGPGPGPGFGGAGAAGFNARASGAGIMERGGPTGGLYNYSQSGSGAGVRQNGNFSRNNERLGRTAQRGNNFANGNQGRNTYNYAGGKQGREFQGRNRGSADFRQGLASGNFFEHGRHFRFRRF